MTPPDGVRWRPRWLLLAASLIMLALAGATFAVALQPATADRFGYALARPNGLPGHFTYQDRTYVTMGYCAGDSSCDPVRARRVTERALRTQGLWPLKQVALLPTFLGANHPILEPASDPSLAGAGVAPTSLFIADPAASGVYVVYTLSGGP